MPKMTLLEMTQETPKSTQWARNNRDKVKARDDARKGTLDGKLISLVTQSKYRAKKAEREHNINTDYLRGLYEGQEGLCALSGLEMTIRGKSGTSEYWYSLSIDRIDSSLGYVEGNVQLVCTGVNRIKGQMADEMFINFCKEVVEYHNA